MTSAQKFAHKRNFGKARIRGMITTVKSLRNTATEEEKALLNSVEKELLLLETEWSNYEKAKNELL